MSDEPVVISHDQLARRVVARLAPDEAASFDLIAQPYLADATHGERAAPRRSGPLASGLDLAGALTPTVVVASGWAITALAQGAAAELTSRGTRLTGAFLDRFRRRSGAVRATVVTAPDPGQLTAVRASVTGKALALGLSPEQAGVLADAVVGELALLSGAQEQQGEQRQEPPRS
ncbi:hypothetical protein ACIOJD_01160 [Streptomyces sp. NPDC088116]|uniref:hypothetical protein n=1 Tax=Streptomyces sp. NPDC088116 TaxID=3365825 RepID=UPI003814CC2D